MLRSCFSAGQFIVRARHLLANAPCSAVASTIDPAKCAATTPPTPAVPAVQASAAAIARPPAVSATEQKPRVPDPPAAHAAPQAKARPPVAAAAPVKVLDIAFAPKLSSREKTLARLDQAITGKTIAGVVAQVIAVASSPDADLADVVRVIQGDPILASRVIHLANSASTGARTRITSIEDATRTIGVRGIQNMAISIGIFSTFPPDELDGFNSMRCWQHSFAVAELMGLIIRQRNPELEGLNYLVGLCHDLGDILLRQNFMGEYDQILQFAHANHHPVHAVESVALGVRHPELISRLLTKISLPCNVVDAIREFYEREIKEQAAGMSANAHLLQIANMAAHGMLLTPSAHELVRPISRTEWRTFGGDRTPPVLDPIQKRCEIVVATNTLARLPAREEERLIKPIIPSTNARIAYVRPELFINLDPLGFALTALADTTILETLPAAEELSQYDAMVIASVRPGVAPLIPEHLAELTQAARRPDMPILGLATQTARIPSLHPALTIRQLPISLADLHTWLKEAEDLAKQNEAAAVPSQ